MKDLLMIVILLFVSQVAFAADKICFSSEVGFRMKQIPGWSNALNIPKYCGLQVIEGFNLNTSSAILYPRLSKLTSKENSKDYIAQDLKKIIQGNQKIKIQDLPNFKTKSGLDFEIKELRGQNNPKGYEIFAHNLQKTTLLNIVFSTDKEETFKKYKSEFYSFLDQIALVSNDELKKLAPVQQQEELERELKRENSK